MNNDVKNFVNNLIPNLFTNLFTEKTSLIPNLFTIKTTPSRPTVSAKIYPPPPCNGSPAPPHGTRPKIGPGASLRSPASGAMRCSPSAAKQPQKPYGAATPTPSPRRKLAPHAPTGHNSYCARAALRGASPRDAPLRTIASYVQRSRLRHIAPGGWCRAKPGLLQTGHRRGRELRHARK